MSNRQHAHAKTAPRPFSPSSIIKKDRAIIHRQAETFDRRQAANARIVKLDFPVFFAYYFASSIKYPFADSHFRMFADVIH